MMDEVAKNDEPDARVTMRHKVGAVLLETQALYRRKNDFFWISHTGLLLVDRYGLRIALGGLFISD